jgi:hypothetical protein
MSRKDPDRRRAVIMSLAALAALFALDVLTPKGLAHGAAYLIVMLEIGRTRDLRLIRLFAWLSCLAVMAGYFVSQPSEVSDAMALVNRLMSLFAVVVVSTLVGRLAELTLPPAAR